MDPSEAEDLMRQQAEVREDREVLLAQADHLSEVWTGLKMDGADVVVLLTELREHEEYLRGLIDHPDRLQVRQATYSRVHLDEVHRQAVEMLDEHGWTAHGPGMERVHVTLRSNRTALAGRLRDRFGDAIEITLGRHDLPLDRAAPDPARA